MATRPASASNANPRTQQNVPPGPLRLAKMLWTDPARPFDPQLRRYSNAAAAVTAIRAGLVGGTR